MNGSRFAARYAFRYVVNIFTLLILAVLLVGFCA